MCLVGGAAAARAAVALQLVSVVLLVETFLFLPGLMPAAMRAVSEGGALLWAPPVWFLGLYAAFAGPRADLLTPLAPLAVGAPGTVAAGRGGGVSPARGVERPSRDGGGGAPPSSASSCGWW